MIQRIQCGNFLAANKNRVNKPAANPVQSQSAVSFKSGGNELQKDTVELINKVKEHFKQKNVSKIETKADDGTKIELEVEKKGISVKFTNEDPESQFCKQFRRKCLSIDTKNDFVSFYSPVAAFMIYDMDKGTVDKPLKDYLPQLLDK